MKNVETVQLEVDNSNSSVSSLAQAMLSSEDTTELVPAEDGFAMAERSPTPSPTNGQRSIQIQQLNGDDREGAGCGSVYFVDSPKSNTEQQLDIAPLSAPEVDNSNSSVSSIAQAALRSEDNTELATAEDGFAMASNTVSLFERMERERLTTEAAGGWQRPHGRGRGRRVGCGLDSSIDWIGLDWVKGLIYQCIQEIITAFVYFVT